MPPFVTFNPGPSELLPGIAEDIAAALESGLLQQSHRSEVFHQVFAHAREGVRSLLELPPDYRIFFVASATEAMEIVVRNLTKRTSFHLSFGAFSQRFCDVARALGRDVASLEGRQGECFDLRTVNPPEAELIGLTHVETATGVELDLGSLAEWRASVPDTFVAVDIVASAPTRRMPWEAADCWFFSVQKACGLPAGLGVLLVGSRAMEKSAQLEHAGADIGFHRRFSTLAASARKDETFETPNVLAIHLLGCGMARMIARGGIDVLERETAAEAAAIYTWLDTHPKLRAFVQRSEWRARTVLNVDLPKDVDPAQLRKAVAEQGLVLGAGYGTLKPTQVRIGNFPAHTPADHARLRAAIDRFVGA